MLVAFKFIFLYQTNIKKFHSLLKHIYSYKFQKSCIYCIKDKITSITKTIFHHSECINEIHSLHITQRYSHKNIVFLQIILSFASFPIAFSKALMWRMELESFIYFSWNGNNNYFMTLVTEHRVRWLTCIWWWVPGTSWDLSGNFWGFFSVLLF